MMICMLPIGCVSADRLKNHVDAVVIDAAMTDSHWWHNNCGSEPCPGTENCMHNPDW